MVRPTRAAVSSSGKLAADDSVVPAHGEVELLQFAAGGLVRLLGGVEPAWV
jgi:hypothetical protein